eukprot:scaffold171333_cov21-Tisochrysis_lutea.AAC.1
MARAACERGWIVDVLDQHLPWSTGSAQYARSGDHVRSTKGGICSETLCLRSACSVNMARTYVVRPGWYPLPVFKDPGTHQDA